MARQPFAQHTGGVRPVLGSTRGQGADDSADRGRHAHDVAPWLPGAVRKLGQRSGRKRESAEEQEVQKGTQRIEIGSHAMGESVGTQRHPQEFRRDKQPLLDGVVDLPAHGREQAEIPHHDFAGRCDQDVAGTQAQVEKRRVAGVSARESPRHLATDHADHGRVQTRTAGRGLLLGRLEQPDEVDAVHPGRDDESACLRLADIDRPTRVRQRSGKQPPTRREKARSQPGVSLRRHAVRTQKLDHKRVARRARTAISPVGLVAFHHTLAPEAGVKLVFAETKQRRHQAPS